MKEFKIKLNRYLSAILMAAMVITGTPQMAMADVTTELQNNEAVTQVTATEDLVSDDMVTEDTVIEADSTARKETGAILSSENEDTYALNFMGVGTVSMASIPEYFETDNIQNIYQDSTGSVVEIRGIAGGTVIQFTVTPTLGRVISEVTNTTRDENGVYSITVTENKTITIASVDKTTNQVSFDYDSHHCRPVNVSSNATLDVVDVDYDQSYKFRIVEQPGYRVVLVEIGDADVDFDGEEYTITAAQMNTDPTVKILCEAIKNTLDYNLDDGITLKYGSDYQQTLSGNQTISGLGYSDDFKFKLETDEDKEIDTVDLDGDPLEAVDGIYTISANALQADTAPTLTVTVRRRITIGCNSKLKSRLTPIRPRGLACNCTFLSA